MGSISKRLVVQGGLVKFSLNYKSSGEILRYHMHLKSIHLSPRGSSIGYEPRLMKRKSQDRIPPPLTLVWTCQKKKKKKKRRKEINTFELYASS
jgi:hypothetical protein